MLYSERPTIPQTRLRCRHPRCGALLKTPAANPRDAFCCQGCERAFYRSRCRVCEQLFSRKTERRQVCGRDKCRYAFKTNPGRFFGSRSLSAQNRKIAHNDARSAHSTGLKSGPNPGRGWRIIAGPTDLHPINLHSFPADAAASRTGRPGPVLFTRTTPPLNVIGGFKSQSAPKVNLFAEPTTSSDPEDTQ